MIVIIDYGAGNLASIHNMLKKVGAAATVSARPGDVLDADKLILPGVGHFDHGMRELKSRGLVDALKQRVLEHEAPLLGICLGAQLLARGSEEGDLAGLGLIDADVKRFDEHRLAAHLKIPFMGWAEVELTQQHALFADVPSPPRYYFVHSYHLLCDREEDVLVKATHGYPFVAGVARRNVFGMQFHPEKSHAFGLKLLDNFARMA